MHQDQAADTRSGKLLGRAAADAADPRNKHSGPFQAALANLAHAGHDHLPCVAHTILIGQFRQRVLHNS